jgi:hypothetical protein
MTVPPVHALLHEHDGFRTPFEIATPTALRTLSILGSKIVFCFLFEQLFQMVKSLFGLGKLQVKIKGNHREKAAVSESVAQVI